MAKLDYGDAVARIVSGRIGGQYLTKAALKSIGVKARVDGQLFYCKADRSLWTFVSDSAVAADGADELVLVPTAGAGRFLRADRSFVARLAFSFATTDAFALLTVPEGFALRLASFPWWEITADMTGGTSSAIGASTSKTGYDTKGDLIGGAAGNVAAGLTAGIRPGTIGGELDNTGFHEILLVEAETIRFDRITSAFTAGSGFINVPLIQALAPATP